MEQERSREMETEAFLDAIQGDLQTVAAGDEASAALAGRIWRTLESSLRLRLLDALGQVAAELSEQLPSGHIEVRLSGRDVQLVYVRPEESNPAEDFSEDEGGTARLTLRMPDSLKSRVELASSREGLSTNSWLVRAVQRSLDRSDGPRRRGHRFTGFAQS
jgi:hypothetical protein